MLGVLTRTVARQQQRMVFTAGASWRRLYTKYTPSHEWVKVEGGVGTIGVTDYAQKALGDVVYVEVPEVGDQVEIEDVVGVVESVKSTSDIYSPVAGEIVAANQDVVANTKLINKDANAAWLFKIKLADEDQLKELLDEAAYKKLTEDADH